MAERLFFLLSSSLSIAISLSPSLLPILFLYLHSISFLSGRSLLALCARAFDMWGSDSPGILLLPCPVAERGMERWRGGREREQREKDVVRYVKDRCSIYLVILRGPHRAEYGECGWTIAFRMAGSFPVWELLTVMESRSIVYIGSHCRNPPIFILRS